MTHEEEAERLRMRVHNDGLRIARLVGVLTRARRDISEEGMHNLDDTVEAIDAALAEFHPQ